MTFAAKAAAAISQSETGHKSTKKGNFRYAKVVVISMKNEYIRYTEKIYFRHEVSHQLPRDVYSIHTHDVYELLYFLGGDASFVIEDRVYKLKKGDMILIRPFRYHFIRIDSCTDYERYDILFDPLRDRIDGIDLVNEESEVMHLSENAIAQNLFQKMDIYHELCDKAQFEVLLPHMLSELFYSMHLFSHESADSGKSLSPLVSDALRYINQALCSVKDVKEVASHLFVSESYLFRCFRAELHQTPKQYIMSKRLLQARQRLSLGESPTIVARELGFGDYTTFYRNYRAFFGQAPTDGR